MSATAVKTNPPAANRDNHLLAAVQEMMRACIQCGTCSASCPNAPAMDLTPRHLWRLVQLGRMEKIFQSHTFTLCSACYYCSLRCPRGLNPSEAMALLKQIAVGQRMRGHQESVLFYRDFIDNVRRNGRVQEMSLMTAYFLHLKNPLRPIRFASLGWKLQSRSKVRLPSLRKAPSKLEALFRRVEEMESESVADAPDSNSVE